MFAKLYNLLDKIRTCAIIVLLGSIICLSLLQIILRYFTSADLKPFAWGDEIVRLTAIWVAFLAASVGVKSNSHLSVEFFLNKFLKPAQVMVAQKTATVVVILALAAVTREGIFYTMNSTKTMLQNLPDLSIAWFYASIPVGCALLIMEYLRVLFRKNPGKGDLQ
ncbi:MAG: TRAP transporter small permease subunit [Lachnospiraceae bacterium]|nr:TRAP transporter small permease subunit [Lachnospiraceae bacterium]